ncbi:MAG: Prefoldin subunit alpha [Nitrosopumilales archaeon]|nr:MAG: Prefoldin subunit alpha [Nitrosopumilales archaeon]
MSEEKAQQLLYQMQMLETYLADLTQKESTLFNILREAASAIESIKTINEKPESETLIPMGMGTFMKAKITNKDKVILNVGSGTAIEKDRDSTINYIESRIKEMEVALKDNSAQKQQVVARLEQGKQEMNRLMQPSPSQKQ